jgi:hypothetical protein
MGNEILVIIFSDDRLEKLMMMEFLYQIHHQKKKYIKLEIVE